MIAAMLALSGLAGAALVIGAHQASSAAALLLRRQGIERPAGALAELFIFVEPERLLRASALAGAAGALAVALSSGSVLGALLAAGIALAMPRGLHWWWRRRYLRRIGAQFPDMIAMLASAVRAGAALAQGLDQLAQRVPAPLGHELALVMRRHRLGVRLEEALQDMARRMPLEPVRLFATSVSLALQVGGGLAGTLDRLAGSLRRKHAIEAKLRSLTSQGRLQAVIVTALPFALMLAMSALDPASMRPLFTTLPGWMVLGGILVLDLSGWLLIRRIVVIDL